MDTLNEVYQMIFETSQKFVDVGICNNDDFNHLEESMQTMVKAFCVSILVAYRWFLLCQKVNKE